MELCVIDYESSYYPQVLQLRNRLLRIPLGLNLFDEDLDEDRDQYVIVAIRDEQVIACVMIRIIDEITVKFRQMAVEEQMQRSGIGSMLIGYAENFCLVNDYTIIELHARKAVHEFYRKLGYSVVGDEFDEVGIPHLKMTKHLPEY